MKKIPTLVESLKSHFEELGVLYDSTIIDAGKIANFKIKIPSTRSQHEDIVSIDVKLNKNTLLKTAVQNLRGYDSLKVTFNNSETDRRTRTYKSFHDQSWLTTPANIIRDAILRHSL